jgi:hypothetical protein
MTIAKLRFIFLASFLFSTLSVSNRSQFEKAAQVRELEVSITQGSTGIPGA